MNLDNLPIEKWMELNAKLQQKKNKLRKELSEKGILKRSGENNFDHYSYFSEAQYKELFTKLFSKNNLELKFNEIEYATFESGGKQSNGRMPKLEFFLIDCDTGFYEKTVITGEGMDKGDKAGYKAYTGALKYYLADTFMVATGDDPETESPSESMNKKAVRKATPKQVEMINKLVHDVPAMLNYYHIEKVSDLTTQQASEIISKKKTSKVKMENGANE